MSARHGAPQPGAVPLSIDAFQDIDLAGACPNVQRTLKCTLAVN